MSCGCGIDTVLTCRNEARRGMVRAAEVNGLDYLEVSDDQRVLTAYFLGPAPEGLGIENIEICGGVRERDIAVIDVTICPQTDPERDNCIVVTVDRPGDFSTYCLCLVNLPEDAPFDPRYRCLEFSFKAACPTDLDCKAERECPEEVAPAPEIDYLAKDYASFRRLILDRLAVVMPEWTERHVPDLGITLVELLAYVGDYLSYHQDAVATEAYLDTARQRVSVKRHARLVDYILHEGCNARTWVAVETSQDRTLNARDLSFLTSFQGAPDTSANVPEWLDFKDIDEALYEVFEPLVELDGETIGLWTAHNLIRIYTWGDSECCLPQGTTSVTLIDGEPSEPMPDDEEEDPGQDDEPGQGDEPDDEPGQDDETDDEPDDDSGQDDEPDEVPSDEEREEITIAAVLPPERALNLQVGDVVIFEEVIGPETGNSADADPARRHAVRLTAVEESVDPITGYLLLEISWAEEDALPAPFCVSTLGPPPECTMLEDVSVVRGNVVLVDHGRRRPSDDLECVPAAADPAVCVEEGRSADVVLRAGVFEHPAIDGPLTFAAPVEFDAPATGLLTQDPRRAVPGLVVESKPDPKCGPQPANAEQRKWTVVNDLLASGPKDTHVVAEINDRRQANLRFGDGRLGRAPDPNSRVWVAKRTGNGPRGNVGADSLALAVHATPISGLVLKPRNPLPAQGGTGPEPTSEGKLFAPFAFGQELARAITPADYAEIAARHPKVQRAAAELRWNGSWYEARVAIDPLGTAIADAELLAEVFTDLSKFRRIGHDLAVRPAVQVALDIAMTVCVEPTHLRAHVKAALMKRFGSGCLPDGSLGYFHPDELSFGDDIAVSRLLAAAQDVDGVESVALTRLQRLYEGSNNELANGVLPIGPLEIARADSDPTAPENGRITFEMRGGR